MNAEDQIHQRPVELLQKLIRFNTTNPPGNERPCVEYIDGLLKAVGIETTLVAKTPQRPNIIARIKGEGKAPPLLLVEYLAAQQYYMGVKAFRRLTWTNL